MYIKMEKEFNKLIQKIKKSQDKKVLQIFHDLLIKESVEIKKLLDLIECESNIIKKFNVDLGDPTSNDDECTNYTNYEFYFEQKYKL